MESISKYDPSIHTCSAVRNIPAVRLGALNVVVNAIAPVTSRIHGYRCKRIRGHSCCRTRDAWTKEIPDSSLMLTATFDISSAQLSNCHYNYFLSPRLLQADRDLHPRIPIAVTCLRAIRYYYDHLFYEETFESYFKDISKSCSFANLSLANNYSNAYDIVSLYL